MDEETIKQYQDLYNFNRPIYAKGAKPNNMPEKDKTYFFVQTDGAIYIGTVKQRQGTYYYTICIKKNINNKLNVKENEQTKILIKYTDPGEKMFLWAEIPNYNSVNNLSENNNSIDNLVDELSTLNLNKEQKINKFLIKQSLKEDDNNSKLIQRNNNSSRGPYSKVERIHNRSTGSRTGIGGKGRKKTKRNKNKNKKHKTHKKR